MAVHVNTRFIQVVLCWALSALWMTSHALGPQAPFVPPVAGQVSVDSAGALPSQAGPEVGLSGVRVGRHAGAIIDGKWVRKGKAVRGARLSSVSRSQVVLKHPDGRQEVLSLYSPSGQTTVAQAAATTQAVKP